MNIDLLPLAAFAPDPSRAPERPRGNTHTLTLRPARPASQSPCEHAMSGSATIDHAPARSGTLLRAAILPAEGSALTITF